MYSKTGRGPWPFSPNDHLHIWCGVLAYLLISGTPIIIIIIIIIISIIIIIIYVE